MLRYVNGDVTNPRKFVPEGTIVIPHVLSETGAFGSGVAAAIRQRWPRAQKEWVDFLRVSRRQRTNIFGEAHLVYFASEDIAIANLCAQRGLISITNPVPLDYTLLQISLEVLAQKLWQENWDHATIHMPRLGCGLAGGSWDEVEPIVEETLKDFIVYVYSLS